jgi:hypothetical protein
MVGAWIVTLLPFAYAAIASYFILIPSSSYVSKSGVDRLTYELTQFFSAGLHCLADHRVLSIEPGRPFPFNGEG